MCIGGGSSSPPPPTTEEKEAEMEKKWQQINDTFRVTDTGLKYHITQLFTNFLFAV